MWSNLPPLQRPFSSASHSRNHSAHASPTPLSFAHSLALLHPQATHAAGPVAVSGVGAGEPSPSPSHSPPPPPPRHQRTHSHGSISSTLAVGHSSFAPPSHAAAAAAAASTTFYLPASPVAATAASRSDSAEVHRQSSSQRPSQSQPQSQAAPLPGESEPVALTELVRRLSWDDAMLPAESGGPRLHLSVGPGHKRQQSGGGGSGSGGEFSPLPLRSQPPSPVLAAIEAQLANAQQQHHHHQQQAQGRSPQHGGPHARQLLLFGGMDSSAASLSPTAAASEASEVEPRFGSLLLHRKIASCPSGLSDLRAGGGTSPAAVAMGGGQAQSHSQAQPQAQHHSSHVSAHMQLPAHLQHPHSHSLQGSPSPSPPHTPSSPIHGHGGGHALQFPGGAAFAASITSTGSSASGKLSHSSSAGGSHHYHPYARSATVPAEQLTQAVQAHHQQQLTQADMAKHRPTVISPASRFLSRKLGPTIPAALIQQQLTQMTVVASPPAAAPQPHMPPPLSLCTLSAQADFNSVMSASAAGASAITSPPSSPHPFAVGAGGIRTPTGGSRGAISTHAHTHAHTSPSGPAPFAAAAGGGSEYGGGAGPSERPSSFPAAGSSLLGGSGGLSSFPTSCASSPQLRPGSEVLMRMPTPDFVGTFDSRDAWGRLSNHSSSPLKHRSLPGTPSLRANAGSVPPTPNSRAVKQRSRRASEQDKQLLESAALLVDFSQLSIPTHSLPLMAALPTNPSFTEQVVSNTFLGSGSYGDVYRTECTSARPFAAQAAAQQALMQGPGPSFLASPPLSLDMPPPPPPPTISNSSSVSSASSVASVSSSSGGGGGGGGGAGTAVESRTYALALKATKASFTTLQERQKYLQRYLHLYQFVQLLRAGIHAQLETSTAASTGATLASLCAASHIDAASFFPRHLVACHVVWQDQCRIYVLMDLCERGDLTTYWSQPAAPFGGMPEDVTDAHPDPDPSCQSTPEDARRRAGTNSDDDEDDDGDNDVDREYEEELRRFMKAEHGGGGSDSMQTPAYLSPLKTLPSTGTAAALAPVAPLCEADLWRLLEEICSALALMHAHNFLHLDIKPSNIYVDGDERFVLGDFDSCILVRDPSTRPPSPAATLAAMFPHMASTGQSSTGSGANGAPFNPDLDALEEGDGLWCAPELLQSMQHASDRADVYSLACSVYGVLADALPEKDGPNGVLLDFSPGALKCPVSMQMQQLLLDMTAAAPQNRPSAAQVLALATRVRATAAATAAAAAGAAAGISADVVDESMLGKGEWTSTAASEAADASVPMV